MPKKEVTEHCLHCGRYCPAIVNEHKEANSMFDNGAADYFYAGYGSKFDGDSFGIMLCDNCIEELHDSGRIVHLGNYLEGNKK